MSTSASIFFFHKPSKRLKARRTRITPNPKGGLHRTHAQKPASPGQESGNHRSLFRHYGNRENPSYKVQAYGEQQATQLPLSHLFFFLQNSHWFKQQQVIVRSPNSKFSRKRYTKIKSYIEKRVHSKIGACIRPVTILTLSDLTGQGETRILKSMCALFFLLWHFKCSFPRQGKVKNYYNRVWRRALVSLSIHFYRFQISRPLFLHK